MRLAVAPLGTFALTRLASEKICFGGLSSFSETGAVVAAGTSSDFASGVGSAGGCSTFATSH